jgi:hypothetical protein
MADPVGTLRSMRRLVGEGGTALVVDEKVAEAFQARGDEVGRLMAGFSIRHCLLAGMADQPSAAAGTVMRAATLREYAARAGFARVEALPIAHGFFMFYRLIA